MTKSRSSNRFERNDDGYWRKRIRFERRVEVWVIRHKLTSYDKQLLQVEIEYYESNSQEVDLGSKTSRTRGVEWVELEVEWVELIVAELG